MSTIEYDPDELDRVGQALARSREVILQQGRQVRGSVSGMQKFRGRPADKFRAETDQLVRQLDRDAQELDRLSKALRTMAAQIRHLRI